MGTCNLSSYKQKVAYHEAGHAAAIHINNRLKNLPPVFFQIIFNEVAEEPLQSLLTFRIDQPIYLARVKGGFLVETLHFAFEALDNQSVGCTEKTGQFINDYRLAFEADIVNLLIGPLAEAKYIAQIDDEPFHPELITVQALKNYGGEADLVVINDYLHSYSADTDRQNECLGKLFTQAYNFINNRENWQAISKLADHILASNNSDIGCNEVAMLLDDKQAI